MQANKQQLFNIVISALLIGAPALAADSGTAPGIDGKITASKNLGAGSCERGAMGGGSCEKGAHGGPKMNLTDAQLEKMSTLKNKFMDSTSAEEVQLGSLYRQMKEVFSKPEVDRQQALSLQSKINAMKNDLSAARLNFKLDEIAILTPEQREQIRHRMLEREAFGGARWGGHKGHGGQFGGSRGGHFEHGGAAGPKQDKA